MAPHDASPKLTYEDYLRIPDDGKRHEIVDGVHFVTAAPFIRHQRLVVRLTSLLDVFVREHRLGELLIAPTDVILSTHDIVQPDLLFISNERNSILTEKNIQGAPDLVIEILSPGTRRRDERIKRDRYAHFGVREYWIVDPELETIKVLELGATGYAPPREVALERSERLSSSIFPGLELPLDQIFTD